ncbi:MAG: FprA family A-type flavoprotein [Candidatus Sumerlaeota bacterium]|nr:FprA family A-type flavoprotein [Candidatus Sumerlaeota bacterium]
MSQIYHPQQISEHVYWVGAIDWTLRDFHGYLTQRGTTYNAFLIKSGKTILIDTVKAPFCDEFFSRIASVVPLSQIDYVVSNHTEMDHSGCLPDILREAPRAQLIASPNGARDLKRHFKFDREIAIAQDGQTLDLGGAQLAVYHTPMLHWPDSMVTWFEQDGILFSQDAFGMHLASCERFADEISHDVLLYEAAKYYANILLPFSSLIPKTLKRLTDLNLPLRMIAPDHGPLYRKDLTWIVERYMEWAGQKPARKAVIVYATMWQSTEKMAAAIEDGLMSGGVAVKRMPLSVSHRSDVALEMLDTGALICGAPTLNNGLFPSMADCLTYLGGLRPKNRIGAAFGSYGWGQRSVTIMNEMLKSMGVELAHPGLSVRYAPDDNELNECGQMGAAIAQALTKEI